MTSFVQKQNQIRQDYKYHREENFKNVICGKTVKSWTFIILFAICAPIAMYFFTIDQGTYIIIDEYTCLVQTPFRVSCAKGKNLTAKQCEKRACCYDEKLNQCYHYLPSKYNYHYDENIDEYVAQQDTTPYNTKSINKMKISVNELTENKVSIILHDANTVVKEGVVSGKKNYVVDRMKNKLMVEVYRTNSKNDMLLSTTRGPLIASKNYWEWSLFLTENYLFGLNQTLIKVDETSTITKVIYKNKNDAHTLPIFWAYTNGNFHGVAIKHEGPLEITIRPKYLITLKSLTGGNIELVLAVGPTPKLLHDQQVVSSIIRPPSWVLDTYVCRRRLSLDVRDIVEKFQLSDYAKSYCVDENLLLALMKDSTDVDSLKNKLTKLNEKGLKFFLAVPPHIIKDSSLYDSAEKLDILYKYNNSVYISQFMEEDVAYPDYSHNNIVSYMEKLHTFFNAMINIKIDAFILNDNWPADEIYKINGNNFPYFSEELMDAMSYTIPWNATTSKSEYHIQKHNSYGSSQIDALDNYYNKEKTEKIIMSATKTVEQVQPMFVQNVESSWDNLRMHVDNILFNSITGNHLVGLPVCGDTQFYNYTLQETLCIRWYLIAATMPLLKMSSVEPWREPTNLKTEYGQEAALNAIQIRSTLVAYFYTILNTGEPVVRPMFYDFYENTTTFSLANQYMLGKDLLFAHPLSPNRKKLQIYLPSAVGIWYEFWGGNMYNIDANSWIDIDIRETDFLAFVAQGSIIPMKEEQKINLVIALNCTLSPCAANGDLLLENNVGFQANRFNVTITNVNMSSCNYTLGYIKLYYYEKDIGQYKHYIKNEDLCKGKNSVTITY